MEQGFFRLGRRAGRRRHLPAGAQGAGLRPLAGDAGAGRIPRLLPLRREKRLRRRRPVVPAPARRCRGGPRQRRVRRRGALPARRLRQAVGDFPLRAVGLQFARTPGSQIPLPRRLLSASRRSGAMRPGNRDLRRLEHRPSRDRPEELAIEPEELGFPAPRNAPGSGASWPRPAGSTSIAACIRKRRRRATRGGRTAGRPGPRTSAGGSITSWRRPSWPPRRSRPRSTSSSASAITRR